MAAAIGECDFDKWLTQKLLKLNPETDIDVFVQYIRSILDTETENEEQHDSIKDFLEQITDVDLDIHTAEVINVYNEKEGGKENSNNGALSFDQQLASAVEKAQSMKIDTTKVLTKEDKERRLAKEAILAQYGQVSEGEESDHGEDADQEGLGKNVNAKAVVERQQAQREKSKQDHEKKKQKDKEDREKQKQKAEDRKETEKKRTQKGEKRR